MHSNMTAALLHHLPKPKTTPKTFNWWVDKYTVVYLSDGSSTSIHTWSTTYLKKQKQTTDTHINNVGSQRHYAKRKKPKTKGYILYDYIYITFWKRKKPQRQKTEQLLPGNRGTERQWLQRSLREFGEWWNCFISW